MRNNRADLPSAALGTMLQEALDRSVQTSLDSLESLRQAVRKYTHHQKSRGMPLDSVMRAVSSVLMEIEDDRVTGIDPTPLRDPELARKLRAWCSEDYSEFVSASRPRT